MALQRLGDVDMAQLLAEMRDWAEGTPLEQRAAAAAICEPRLLGRLHTPGPPCRFWIRLQLPLNASTIVAAATSLPCGKGLAIARRGGRGAAISKARCSWSSG